MPEDAIPREARDDSIEVAGWEDPTTGEWVNAEADAPAGAVPRITQRPDGDTLEGSTRIVVRWVDGDGEVHYRTTSHITPDYSIRDWLRGAYGVEFV